MMNIISSLRQLLSPGKAPFTFFTRFTLAVQNLPLGKSDSNFAEFMSTWRTLRAEKKPAVDAAQTGIEPTAVPEISSQRVVTRCSNEWGWRDKRAA
jgi:hypothetical protein